MTSYASNSRISRPLGYDDWKADFDFNGILWSNKYGLMFEVEDDYEPIRLPTPYRSR